MMYIASMNLKETEKIEKGMQEVKSNENEQIYIILSFPYTLLPVKVRVKVVMCQKIVFM